MRTKATTKEHSEAALPRLLTTETVATALHFDPDKTNDIRAFKRLVEKAGIPFIRRGNEWLFTPEQLNALIEQMHVQPRTEPAILPTSRKTVGRPAQQPMTAKQRLAEVLDQRKQQRTAKVH